MPHLVTRYNKKTHDLNVIAITSSIHSAHGLINKDVATNGAIGEVTKSLKGAFAYSLEYHTTKVMLNVKEHGTILEYTITTVPSDELVNISTF